MDQELWSVIIKIFFGISNHYYFSDYVDKKFYVMLLTPFTFLSREI